MVMPLDSMYEFVDAHDAGFFDQLDDVSFLFFASGKVAQDRAAYVAQN
jgi:hypothetical protein